MNDRHSDTASSGALPERASNVTFRALDFALDYARAGLHVFPLEARGKRPLTPHGFHDATTDENVIRAWWEKLPDANIGIRTGRTSNVDVLDVDGPEGAATLAAWEHDYGPLAGNATVRTSNGRHVYFLSVGFPAKAGLYPGIDTRGEGGYVVAPPSVHDSGAVYEWETLPGECGFLPAPPWLVEKIRAASSTTDEGKSPERLDTAKILLQGIPEGARDETLMRYARRLRGMNLTREEASSLILMAADSCQPPFSSDEALKKVDSAFRKFASNEEELDAARELARELPTRCLSDPGAARAVEATDALRLLQDRDRSAYETAIKRLQEVKVRTGKVEQDIARSRQRNIPEPATAKPTIMVSTEILDMALKAERAMRAAGVELYVNGGKLVTIIRETADTPPVAKIVRAALLRGIVSEYTSWIETNAKGEIEYVLPPREVTDALLERGQWGFPPLVRIALCPILTKRGAILSRPGYDEDSGIFLHWTGEPIEILPTDLTRANAREARELLEAPLCDFPFREAADRAAAIAGMLTYLADELIDDPIPLLACDANVAGTGKGKLISSIFAPVTGAREMKFRQYPGTDVEFEKRLVSAGLRLESFFALDNIPAGTVIDYPTLASAQTARYYHSRRLGVSEDVRFRVPQIIVNGNNLLFGGDIPRRVTLSGMLTHEEHPEQRSRFKFRLPDWSLDNRAALVRAGLVVLAAYQRAGSPSVGTTPLGSFERWSRIVRDAWIWAGGADPLASQRRLWEEQDAGRDALQRLFAAWTRIYRDAPTTVRRLLTCGDEEIKGALADHLGVKQSDIEPRAVGFALRSLKNRTVAGFRLKPAGDDPHSKVARWMVEAAPPPPPPLPAGL